MTPSDFRKIRKKLKLTQTEFGHKLKMSIRQVARYEGGETPIPIYRVLMINSILSDDLIK